MQRCVPLAQPLDEADADDLVPDRPALHLTVAEIVVHLDNVGVALFGTLDKPRPLRSLYLS